MDYRDIPGWCCPRLLAFYDEVAASITTGIFVEVGVAYGRSLAYMASKAAPGVQILGVDSWLVKMGRGNPEVWAKVKGYGTAYDAAANFLALSLEPHQWDMVELCQGNSPDVARALDFEVDVVFLDGSHEYESVLADIRAWLPRVKRGGVIAGHDCNDHYPGVERAVREVFRHGKAEFRYPEPPETWGGVWRVEVK